MMYEDVIAKVEGELNLPAEQFDRYAAEVREVMEELTRKEILFEEGNAIAFIAHLITMLNRLDTGEKVQEMGEEILDQIEDQAVSITREFIETIEQRYQKVDTAEVILAAIHIQTAMEIMNEK